MPNIFVTRPWAAFLLLLLWLSLACNASANGSPTASPASPPPTAVATSIPPTPVGELVLQQQIVFGPGPFIYTDTQAGLADLSSYKATLILTFDGTKEGQARQWSRTYVMTATKDPAARQWTIETTGDLSNPGALFLAEMAGVDYERRGEEACTAAAIQEGDSLTGRLELASFLTGVIGAQVSGDETVNAVKAKRYFFGQQALGEQDLTEVTGDLWVATEGNYIVKYLLTRKGKADYFGEGIEGTMTLSYDLTEPNQPVTIQLPDDCPPGMVDAPLLPDAANISKGPGVLSYETATSVADAVAFYQQQIPSLGWKAEGQPSMDDKTAALDYKKGSQTITVIINATDSGTAVQIFLENVQE